MQLFNFEVSMFKNVQKLSPVSSSKKVHLPENVFYNCLWQAICLIKIQKRTLKINYKFTML
jgi:hypothetical protein